MAGVRLVQIATTLFLLSASACAHESAAAGESAQTTPATGAAAAAPAPIETKEVAYDGGGVHMKGFIAYPAGAAGKRPGVLVVHEWWGLNDYVRSRAHQLAEMGYVALAIDMYGDGKIAAHPDEAKKYMSEMLANLDSAVQRFKAAQTLLMNDPRVDGSKLAAIGYCFGGAVVLHMARIGDDLDAVASFHGNLVPQIPMKKDAFAGQMLVATGGDDPFVPPEQVEAFKQEMAAADQNYELVIYPGAKHAFTNPAATDAGKQYHLPLEYNAEADAASWQKLRELFARIWPN
jgi:dienelactone hydrolase